MNNLKKCIKCSLEKEENSDNFYWRNDSGKFSNKCKTCVKNYKKEYYQENKEEILKDIKEYRQENKEEISQYQKKYYQENKEEILKNQKIWYEENKEEILQYQKEYQKENKEEIIKYKKQHYEENKEEILKDAKGYRQENKDKISRNKKQYYQENKEEISKYRQENKKSIKEYAREYQRNRRKNDPIWKFMRNISVKVRNMLKGKKAGKSSKNILPFTEKQIIEHMEKWFNEPGNEWMNWNNQGAYNIDTWDPEDSSTWKWQLDHKTPISRFKNIDIEHPETDPEFHECWNLSNLRPLSAKQNIEEGNRR